MGLEPGQPLIGTKVDWVFIGSCTNSRISDLRAAAAVIGGRKRAAHVTAWVVPGSEAVKAEAEAEGLHHLFRAAGFEWREPGCALCVAANGEAVPPGANQPPTINGGGEVTAEGHASAMASTSSSAFWPRWREPRSASRMARRPGR